MLSTMASPFIDASRILGVIFIFAITISNVALIFVQLRTPQFLYKPKCLVLISLAIGDILVALFSLVIAVTGIFSYSVQLHCITILTAFIYSMYLIHFVYGIGLTVLAVEFRIRGQNSTVTISRMQIVRSFGVSAIPWILGLLVILPQTMGGMEQDIGCYQTYSPDHRRALWVISVIVPACIALIAAIVLLFISTSDTPTTASSRPLNPQNVNAIQPPPTSRTPHHPHQQQSWHPLLEIQDGMNCHPQQPPCDTQGPQDWSEAPPPYESLNPSINGHDQQLLLPECTQSPQDVQYNTQSQPYTYNNSQPSAHVSVPAEAPAHVSNAGVSKERKTLFWVSVAYVFLVMPLPCLILSFHYDVHTTVVDVIYMLVHWLAVARSSVTPIIWVVGH